MFTSRVSSTDATSRAAAGQSANRVSRIADPVRRFVRTPKGTLLLVFGVLLAVAGTATGWAAVGPHALAAVLGATAADLVLGRVMTGRFGWPSSALLSGLIVAFILGPDTSHAITLYVAALASGSKYLLRTQRGHLFNPAALALLISIPLFSTGQSWWGAGGDLPTVFLALLLAGGALIVDRINKFPLVLSFLFVYFGLFAALGFAAPTSVAEMFRAPFVQAALFLALFMLTDPPTSPSRYGEQIWIGGLAAAVACAAQLLGAGQAYLLFGVLAANGALALSRGLRTASARAAKTSLSASTQ